MKVNKIDELKETVMRLYEIRESYKTDKTKSNEKYLVDSFMLGTIEFFTRIIEVFEEKK